MEKRKLKKMKVLEPSKEMVLAAESDIPVIGNMAYERMKYPIGLFIQAEMDENILKIGFFITDILTAGGRRIGIHADAGTQGLIAYFKSEKDAHR